MGKTCYHHSEEAKDASDLTVFSLVDLNSLVSDVFAPVDLNILRNGKEGSALIMGDIPCILQVEASQHIPTPKVAHELVDGT